MLKEYWSFIENDSSAMKRFFNAVVSSVEQMKYSEPDAYWKAFLTIHESIFGKHFNEDLANLNLSNLSNPSEGKNNNVLMMYNETTDTLSYKSEGKTLTEKTYHKFEIDVQTQSAPLTISLVSTFFSAKTISEPFFVETREIVNGAD